jgi:hypothetical protein
MRYSVALFLLLLTPSIALAQIGAGITTAVALEQLETKANNILAEAVEAGDYLATKAAIEALNVIDHAELAYAKQLENTVEKVEGLLRRLNDVDAMLDDADSKITAQLDDVGRLETRIAQIASDTLPGQAGPYVANVKPTIIRPKASGTHRFLMRGVDHHDIKKMNDSGELESAEISQLNEQEFVVQIPVSEFAHDTNSLSVHTFPMTLIGDRRLWVGPRKKRDTTLTVGALSTSLATYSYKGHYYKTIRESRSIKKSPGQMKATNKTKHKWAKPTSGWKVDITKKITVKGTGGNQGKCEGHVDNELSENGIKLQARLDKIGRSLKYPNGAPGRISCHAYFTEYRDKKVRTPINGSGILGWTKDELIELPHKNAEITINVSLFDGTVIQSTGSRDTTFLEIQRDNQFVLLKPTPPRDV